MADSPGRELLDALRSQLLQALARTGDSLALDGLGPAGPEWAGTGLEARLLDSVTDAAPADPLAVAMLRGLEQLAVGAAGDRPIAAIHGWEQPPEPRGLAYALRTGGGELALALVMTGDVAGPRLRLVATGKRAAAATAVTRGDWALNVAGEVNGHLEAAIGVEGPPELSGLTDGDWIRIEFTRSDRGQRLGPAGGPSLTVGAIRFGGELRVGADLTPQARAWVATTGGELELLPSALAGLVRGLPPLPFSVDLDLDPVAGASLGGSTTLRARVPASSSLPAVELQGLDFALDPQPRASELGVGIEIRAALRFGLAGLPIRVLLDGAGLQLPFAFGDGVKLGLDGDALTALDPTGAGVDLDLPVISGAGLLSGKDGRFAGMLTASLPPLSAAAFGVLALERESKPLSFLVLMGATFPPPGIQIGFGFAVSGIGGVVGVNCRVDRDALLRAVTDGTAAKLLFPTDPRAAGDAAIATLPAIFPPAPGSVVAGPMFQLSWGGRIVTASVAVLMEISGQPRMTILGRLTLALPDPEAPLILLQASFAGVIDPGEPSVAFVASLAGSHIVGVPVSGDLCLVTRGGDEATFALSAGGFHPAFAAPRGVPPMRRIGMDLSPLPVIDLRCDAYVAVTTNTVQFGARLELVAEIAGCGLRGHLGFDVLIQWRPQLAFIADMSAGIAVEVFGETLLAVNFDLRLEGPTPWHAVGRGSVDLFIFSASFDFDETWGSQPTIAAPPPDVGDALEHALRAPGAWIVQRPASARMAVRLTPQADEALGRGRLVDPHGVLTVRQRAVPLGVTIKRFNRLPVPDQAWELGSPMLDADTSVEAGPAVFSEFAPGQFLDLRDDELLRDPAFEPLRAGFELGEGGPASAELKPASLEFETKVIGDRFAPSQAIAMSGKFADVGVLETIALAADAAHPFWWQPPDEVVTVATVAPIAVASTWSLVAEEIETAAGTATELRQDLAAAGRYDLTVVGAWEVFT
jgi:uncharacterized protein DUF6603